MCKTQVLKEKAGSSAMRKEAPLQLPHMLMTSKTVLAFARVFPIPPAASRAPTVHTKTLSQKHQPHLHELTHTY